MNSFKKLIELCQAFSQGKITIQDFQSRIETLPYPDVCSKQYYNILHNAVNRLEERIFCNSKSEYIQLGSEVAQGLIKETELEEQRIRTTKFNNQ